MCQKHMVDTRVLIDEKLKKYYVLTEGSQSSKTKFLYTKTKFVSEK